MSLDDLTPTALRKRRGEKWQHHPEDVLPAWVADMDFEIAEPILEMLAQTVRDSDVGYPRHPTALGLPTVFCERMARLFDWHVDPSQVEIITDVCQGFFIGLEVLSEPHEGAIVQTPIYPPFLQGVREIGRTLVEQPLVYGPRGFEIDFDAMRAGLTPDTRVLMLCNPHNPAGRAFTRAELEGLAEIALENDLWILSDEIHAELVYSPNKHIPIAALAPEVEARTVTFMSASKAFNIAGLRIAVAAYGSPEIRRAFDRIPGHIRGGLGTIGLAATEIAWTLCDDWLASTVAYLDNNRKFTDEYLRKNLPEIVHTLPEATYLYWMDCAGLALPDRPYSFFLEEAKVGLSDGKPFGTGDSEDCVRLNFATPRAILVEVLDRMTEAVHAARR